MFRYPEDVDDGSGVAEEFDTWMELGSHAKARIEERYVGVFKIWKLMAHRLDYELAMADSVVVVASGVGDHEALNYIFQRQAIFWTPEFENGVDRMSDYESKWAHEFVS